MAKHILSVSYDEPLLRTREILLRRQGYSVTSALGFTGAAEYCKTGEFDLFILGHTLPHGDKLELMRTFRANCAAPVLALRRYGDVQLLGADAQIYSDDIEDLLSTVESMLRNLWNAPGKSGPARRMGNGSQKDMARQSEIWKSENGEETKCTKAQGTTEAQHSEAGRRS